jgi:hypothetical protein
VTTPEEVFQMLALSMGRALMHRHRVVPVVTTLLEHNDQVRVARCGLDRVIVGQVPTAEALENARLVDIEWRQLVGDREPQDCCVVLDRRVGQVRLEELTPEWRAQLDDWERSARAKSAN